MVTQQLYVVFFDFFFYLIFTPNNLGIVNDTYRYLQNLNQLQGISSRFHSVVDPRNGTFTCCINKTRIQDGDNNFRVDEFPFACQVRGVAGFHGHMVVSHEEMSY